MGKPIREESEISKDDSKEFHFFLIVFFLISIIIIVLGAILIIGFQNYIKFIFRLK